MSKNCLEYKNIKLQEYQKIPAYFILNPLNRGILLFHSLGSGKCHGIDTPIIMADGSIKKVQNIREGDFLMGDDSKKRKVLSLVRGKDEMYQIIPVKGDPYIVNKEHILCLKMSTYPIFEKNDKYYNIRYIENNEFKSKSFNKNKEEALKFLDTIKNEQIIEISVKDYLKLSQKKRSNLKGYKVAIDFPEKKLPLDPYMLGFWIGDGASNTTKISSQDSKVLFYFREKLKDLNLMLTYSKQYDYYISSNRNPIFNGNCNECNKILIKKIKSGKKEYYFCSTKCSIIYKKGDFNKTLQEQNLINNKHIPDIYKFNSRENRLKLLAGLIDSDGHLQKNGGFEFTQKNEKVMDDIIYLCRSLGFSCYKAIKKTSWTYKGIKNYGTAFRIHINGVGLEEIPTLCDRKKASPRKQIKDVLVTGIKVNPIGNGNYYGFNIDSNRRYLLGDFTVTHNSLTSIAMVRCLLTKYPNKHVIVLTPASLVTNYEKELDRVKEDLTQDLYDKIKVYTYLKYINKIKRERLQANYDTILVIDESQNFLSSSSIRYKTLFDYSKGAYKVILLSATIVRNNVGEIANELSLINGYKVTSGLVERLAGIRDTNKRLEALKTILKCRISYYKKSKTNESFPERINHTVELRMSKEYYDKYYEIQQDIKKELHITFKDTINLKSFYNGIRKASNIVTHDIGSPKIKWTIHKIQKDLEYGKKVLVYSNWIGAGVELLKQELIKLRIPFSEVTGNLTQKEKDINIQKYNDNRNKVIIISSSGSEGLNLKNTRTVILLEKTWNNSKLEQVIGRAIRLNSHASLPEHKRKVDVYNLLLLKPLIRKKEDKVLSADELLDQISNKKEKYITNFYNDIKILSINNDLSCF